MKNKLIYKILFAAVLGLGLISCTNDLSQRGEISFSVPEQLFQTIANRNVIDTEQSSVSKDTQLTLKIDLYEADGQIIDSISKTNAYETWLNLSKRGSVVFNFNSIEIGKAVYAELTLSANEGKKAIEICKEKSNIIVIGRKNNVLRFTLTFESKKDKPVNPDLIDTYNSFIINDGLLDLSITPDDILYINSGTITIKAVSKLDGSDLTMDPDIEWTASLLYGNKDINNYSPSSDKKYYRFSATNGPRIQIINQLTGFGTYQLYVTAKYNGIITSQLFNVEVEELAYFNLNTEDSDFGNKLDSIQNSLAIPALLKISGETSQTTFETIIGAINIINVALDVDLGGITGITELTYSYPFSNNNAYSIILPQSLTKINSNTFYDCNYLRKISLPATLQEITGEAFQRCASINEFEFYGSYNENNPVKYTTNEDGSVVFKTDSTDPQNPVKSLALICNYYADKTINFETDFPGVSKIESYALLNGGLLELTLILNSDEIIIENNGIAAKYLILNFDITAENASKVKTNILSNISSLVHIEINGKAYLPDLAPPSNDSAVHTDSFFSKNYYNLSSLTINSTEDIEIGNYQFANYSRLSSVITTNAKITRVGTKAFYKCTYLSTISEFGTNCIIGDSAFENCTSMITINLNNVSVIGQRAFYNIKYLSSPNNMNITIPSSVIAIGSKAFSPNGTGKNPNITIEPLEIPDGKKQQWYYLDYDSIALSSITEENIYNEISGILAGVTTTTDEDTVLEQIMYNTDQNTNIYIRRTIEQ